MAVEWDWEAHLGRQRARWLELLHIESNLGDQLDAVQDKIEKIKKESRARAKVAGTRVRSFTL